MSVCLCLCPCGVLCFIVGVARSYSCVGRACVGQEYQVQEREEEKRRNLFLEGVGGLFENVVFCSSMPVLRRESMSLFLNYVSFGGNIGLLVFFKNPILLEKKMGSLGKNMNDNWVLFGKT